MQSKYRKALMKNYRDFLTTLSLMNHNPIHHKVWEAMEDYEDAGKSLQRAIFLAVEDHKHIVKYDIRYIRMRYVAYVEDGLMTT